MNKTLFNEKILKLNLQRNRGEILLKNLIDGDVQTIFLPLDVMSAVTLYPKYRIQDNYITPNSRVAINLSLLGTITYISLLVCQFTLMCCYYENSDLIFFASIYDTSHYCFGFFINFILCLKYSEYNVKFVLALQDVHRFLNIGSSFRSFTVWNWVMPISCATFAFMSYLFYFIALELYVSEFSSFIVIIFDLNIIYAIRIIKLLEITMVLWNAKALKLPDFDDADAKLYNQEVFKAFCKILKCYELYKVLFRIPVSSEKI